MPEGDSIHRVARSLRALVGERVEAESPHPRGAVLGVASRLDGRRLERVEAVGKNLLLRFDGGVTLRSHLRMKGRWRVQPRGTPMRGKPWLVLRGGELEAVQWNGPLLELRDDVVRRLGPDILAEPPDLSAMVSRLRRAPPLPLGEALQRQELVAGIGNMWAAEALWAARLSPWRLVGEVEDEALEELLKEAHMLMSSALAGSRSPRRVYRRVGRPCGRCGTPIRSRGQGDANRIAYWCPTCQALNRVQDRNRLARTTVAEDP
jgi:endonuclease-8